MSFNKHFKLNNGCLIPAIGLGSWTGVPDNSDQVTEMVKAALRMGYRHVDTAANYGNEESVGKALREANVSQSEMFITTKLDQSDHGRVSEALEMSLKKLGVAYVDLYLMHWPMAYDAPAGKTLQPRESSTFVETWKEMEKLVASGAVKAIGVSNFSVKRITVLLEHASIVPAVNQVELHPCLPQHELLAFCDARGILLTAYSPVWKHKFADNPLIVVISETHRATPAQALLSWGVQRGTAVIPKTVREERLRENLKVIHLTTMGCTTACVVSFA